MYGIHRTRPIHSDHGFHYTNPQYIQRVERLGLAQSMSRKGNCLRRSTLTGRGTPLASL